MKRFCAITLAFADASLESRFDASFLELGAGANLTWSGRWQERVRESGASLPDLKKIEKDSPFGTGPGRKVTCVGTKGVLAPVGFSEPTLQPLVPATSIDEVWAYNDAGRYGASVQGMKFVALALASGELNGGAYQILFGTDVPKSAALWGGSDCDYTSAKLTVGARADSSGKEGSGGWEGSSWRIYRQVTCVGTWGTHLPWSYTKPVSSPKLPKSPDEVWRINVAGDFGSNVQGMRYALVSLSKGQENGGTYDILFSNSLPPEKESVWEESDCEFGVKQMLMGAAPDSKARTKKDTSFGGRTWKFYKREATCAAEVAVLNPAAVMCNTNNYWGGWRSSNDCSPQITNQADMTTWNHGYGVHFTEWAKITLAQSTKVSQVEVFHWTGLQCNYEVQYDSGDGRWIKACDVAGSPSGKETCKSGFPAAPIEGLRIFKDRKSRCPDGWFRLTGVRVSGNMCQAFTRCSEPFISKAQWEASPSVRNRDGGARGDLMRAVNDYSWYVRYRSYSSKKFFLTLTLREASTVAAVGLTVGNSPDCQGEGYGGIKVELQASGKWVSPYEQHAMFGNYERGAQYQDKAKGFVLDQPYFHSFTAVSGVTVARVTLYWADICGTNSISLNNIHLVGMPCEFQATTATTTEAFQWSHLNTGLVPDWKARKELGRVHVHQHWQRGAFTASELTMKSRKKGIRFKASYDAVIMVGLSHGNGNDYYWDIDYSMYVYTWGRRLWYRNGPGSWWGSAHGGAWQWKGFDQDVFEVRLSSDRTKVEYVNNNRVKYTAPETAWFPMNADTSIYRGSIYDVSWVCEGGCSEEPGYELMFLETDAKRWARGPNGPSGSERPNGEGYTSGEYALFTQQSLDSCKMLCNERYWCAGFGFKHTDSFGDEPDWQEGTCQLVSQLVETTSHVKNFDSYKKAGMWKTYGRNSGCRIDEYDQSEDGVGTVERLQRVGMLEACKVICQKKNGCKGIEYFLEKGECELWFTNIGTSAGISGKECLIFDDQQGKFERIGGLGCGHGGKCGSSNRLHIGANGEDWDHATREGAMEVCGAKCESSESCGGFNYVEGHKKCYYRKSATCNKKKQSDRDCFVRRGEVPSDERATTTTTTEVYFSGCFMNQGSKRKNNRERGSQSMPSCAALAKKRGMLYFGMEYPQGYSKTGDAECMTLDEVPDMDSADDSDCDKETWDKKGLGNAHRLAVYSLIKVCASRSVEVERTPEFKCRSSDYWHGWRRSGDCSAQITRQSDVRHWNYGYGVHFHQWAEITLPYAMQLDQFDVYHWTGMRCWYDVQYKKGTSWRRACRLRSWGGGMEACRSFPKGGVQQVRIIKGYHTRCPDSWFRLTGVSAYGKSCQACPRQVLDTDESERHYHSVYNNDKKGFGHAQSRLDSPAAWSCKSNRKDAWMSFDLGAKYAVQGVITKGRGNMDQWVTSYIVQYSSDNKNWKNAPGGYGGNVDRNTQRTVSFLRPVSARYVKIVVKSWHMHVSMRAAVMICDALLPVADVGGRLTSALSTSCSGIDMWRYVHDDGGLTWFSKNFVYYEGDYRIVRYNAGNTLTYSSSWRTHMESVHADPHSGQIYHLRNSGGGNLASYQTFRYVSCLSSSLGRKSTVRLSQDISMNWYRVFIGDEELVVLDRSNKWVKVKLSCSGTLKVTTLVNYNSFSMYGCERGRQGGILENDGQNYWIIYMRGYAYRRAISGPATNQETRISGYTGDSCSVTVDYVRNRWYWHREGGHHHEGVYTCPATFGGVAIQSEDKQYDLISDNGGTRLYSVPMPSNVYSHYLGNWRATFRITNFHRKCPAGWQYYNRNCYRYMGWGNFRSAESTCNSNQAHVFAPESDAEYDWVDMNVPVPHSWTWIGVYGSSSGSWTQTVSNLNRVDGQDPWIVSNKLSARPSPGHTVDQRWRPCYIYHPKNGYWRYHWHYQHCHEGRYFVCKMPLKGQPDSWFHPVQSGYFCQKTSYKEVGSGMTISGCYEFSKKDSQCNGQGFHYYHLRLGKFGVCMCGTKADIRDDGSCVSKLVEQVKTNAVFNHIYSYRFYGYYLAGNNYCLGKDNRRAEGSEVSVKSAGGCQAACSMDAYCFGYEWYPNTNHENFKCWIFTGHKMGNVMPVRAYTGRRYKDATCYIKVASFEDSCHNDYGVPGYKYSHMGYWSRYLRASGGDASLQKCAEQCDRAGFPCIGFHMYEDGAARHCYVYSQERSFHTTIQDARNKAFIRCKVPSWRNNDQGLSFEHFEEKCDAEGKRLCSYKELCPAGKGREAFGGRQADGDAWCPIKDGNAANFVRCGSSGASCQKLTEYGSLQKHGWPLEDSMPELKDAYSCCE